MLTNRDQSPSSQPMSATNGSASRSAVSDPPGSEGVLSRRRLPQDASRPENRAHQFQLGVFLGCVAALLAGEAALRVVATPSAGESGAQGIRVRQYNEGISSATFGANGVRLTGNPWDSGAEAGLVVGDSHVEALQVQDRETMGSVLERRLRDVGRPVNVLQYGIGGAAAPMYCLAAPFLLKRWQPAWVVVLLNRNDLGYAAFEGTAHFALAPDNSVSLVGPRGLTYLGPDNLNISSSGLQNVFRHSVIATLIYRRYKELRNQADPSSDASGNSLRTKHPIALAPEISVSELKKAYGSRLLIAYDPEPEGAQDAVAVERQVLRSCETQAVPCFSLRDALAPDRLPRGFHNTAPNVGHYNATGHRLVARALFEDLRFWRESK
jgi:hypothetical protein